MIIEINSDLSAKVYDDTGKRGFGLPTYDPRTMSPFRDEDHVRECATALFSSEMCANFEEADWHPSAHEVVVVEETPAEEPAPAPVAE